MFASAEYNVHEFNCLEHDGFIFDFKLVNYLIEPVKHLHPELSTDQALVLHESYDWSLLVSHQFLKMFITISFDEVIFFSCYKISLSIHPLMQK